MENALFIGNGLNLCLPKGMPWLNLLDNIATGFGLNSEPNIDMPLEFERLINTYLSTADNTIIADIYYDVKQQIANQISGIMLPKNSIHERIKDLNVNSIITTNYDLLLEYVSDPTFVPKSNAGLKYPEKSIGVIGDVSYFHPHGIYTMPGTICLGYEHYMGVVEKTRKALKEESSGVKKIKSILMGKTTSKNTWYEKFFTSNIAIIGFGLYQCEVDIWWLLTQRASWYYTDFQAMKQLIKNNIVYYDIEDDTEKNDEGDRKKQQNKQREQQIKHKLLKGMNVIVHTYKLSETSTQSYEEAYNIIFDGIQRRGIE